MRSRCNPLLRFLFIVCLLAQSSLCLAENTIQQQVQEYLEGKVSIETIRSLSFTEQEVLAALQAATSADEVHAGLFVGKAVLLLPGSVAAIVTAATTAAPGSAAAIVTAATTVAPGSAAAIVTAATTVAPGSAAAIVTAATTVAPDSAAAIVTAAITVAPGSEAAIVTAATTAAPEQAAAISSAVSSVTTEQTNSTETLNPAEGVPTAEPDPSPTQP